MIAYWATDEGGLTLPDDALREDGTARLVIGTIAAAILRRELGESNADIVFNLHASPAIFHGCSLEPGCDVVTYIRRETMPGYRARSVHRAEGYADRDVSPVRLTFTSTRSPARWSAR